MARSPWFRGDHCHPSGTGRASKQCPGPGSCPRAHRDPGVAALEETPWFRGPGAGVVHVDPRRSADAPADLARREEERVAAEVEAVCPRVEAHRRAELPR